MTKKLSTPFAVNSKLRNDIPVSTITAGQASYDVGFPSETFQSLANGGIPPDGKDFNGVLHDISANIVDMNMGLPQYFDDAYATLTGGYPIGARLCLNDNSGFVVSTITGNQNDPNSNIAGWKRLDYQEYDFKTAQPIQYYYNQIGNWDDAIFRAQLNVYLKGFSPVLIFPPSEITITKPIKLGIALGFAIHDYLVANNIETDFYNATTYRFKKTWYHSLIGQVGYQTTIVWDGSKDKNDKTWRDWAMIHCGNRPTDRDWIKKDDPEDEKIVPLWNDRVRMHSIQLLGNGNWIHGIYLERQTGLDFSFIGVQGVVGAGVFIDRCYDSVFHKLTVLQAGRMVGETSDEGSKNNYDVYKQLYAPIHITKSSGDNCNYLRFRDTHTELNHNVVADIMVTGNSSPVWFENHHYECGAWAGGYGKNGTKSVFKIGSDTGVEYFAQELESDFNASKPSLNQGGAYVYAKSIAGTIEGYTYGLITGAYSFFSLKDTGIPNSLMPIKLMAGNTPNTLFIENSMVSGIEDMGGNASDSPITLISSTISGDINLMYRTNIVSSDSKIESITGSVLSNKNPFSFSNCNVGSINISTAVTVNGNLSLTSTTTSSNIQIDSKSNLTIDNYEFFNSGIVE